MYKLKRVSALVLRYKTILLCRIRKQKAAFPKNVSVEELQCAETSIIVYLQRQHFPMLFEFRDDKASNYSAVHISETPLRKLACLMFAASFLFLCFSFNIDIDHVKKLAFV